MNSTNWLHLTVQVSSALLSAISWIIRGGAGNSMDSGDLHSELLQLGTPR